MSTPVSKVGFYRESPLGDADGPSLHEAVRQDAHPDTEQIVEYLRSVDPLMMAGRAVHDPLDPARKHIALFGWFSDGVWAWPDDLAYYVERYHVELPDVFLSRMREHNWKAPTPPEWRMDEIERELFGELHLPPTLPHTLRSDTVLEPWPLAVLQVLVDSERPLGANEVGHRAAALFGSDEYSVRATLLGLERLGLVTQSPEDEDHWTNTDTALRSPISEQLHQGR